MNYKKLVLLNIIFSFMFLFTNILSYSRDGSGQANCKRRGCCGLNSNKDCSNYNNGCNNKSRCGRIGCCIKCDNCNINTKETLSNKESGINLDKSLKTNYLPDYSNALIDVVIIGSGPAGLSAAIHTSRAKCKTIVITGEIQGGQLMGTTWVENFPACSKILGSGLIQKLKDQAKSFGADICEDSVEKIDFSVYPYKILTKNGVYIYGKTLIISAGVSAAYLGVKGEKEYWSKGVSNYVLSEAPNYKNKNVFVVGGGDSALEFANTLSRYAKQVKILVRGSKLRAIKSAQENIENLKNVSIIYNTSIREIIGDGNIVKEILLFNDLTSKENIVKADGVFVAIGGEPNTAFLDGALELDSNGYILLKKP
ncbi:MAG: Thioredoxin reductase, partial [uncultured bacterium]